jgi:hypothetical protein
MPFKAVTYRVLIASPSDLGEERNAATEAVHEWNEVDPKNWTSAEERV